MVDEFKTIRDSLFRALTGSGSEAGDDAGDEDDDDRSRGSSPLDASAARALIGALFARAGKGKDEVVQIIAREIGGAVAAMLKEPLAQLAKHQKLQISFEFVPKSKDAGGAGEDSSTKAVKPSKKKRGRRATAAATRRKRRASRLDP